MTAPISGSRPQRLELQRETPFKAEADKGETLTVAMAATVFKKLQDGGLVPAKAVLSGSAPGGEGTWQQQLAGMISDTDGNGQLDLDLSQLASMLGGPSVDKLDAVLTGRTAGLPDAFIKSQGGDLYKKYELTSKAVAVQDYARGMVLTTEQDRSTTAFLADATNRAQWSPTEAKAVAQDALNGATVLTMRGDGRRARELLDGTGKTLTEAGRLGEAAEVYGALTKPPHAAVKRNLMQGLIDEMKVQVPTFDERTEGISAPAGANTVQVKASTHASTVGQMAQVRLNQLQVQTQMEATLGHKVDPTDLGEARAFFDAFSKGKPNEKVAAQYQGYLQAFFKHAGEGVEWTKAIPLDERGERISELLDGQPADEAGRTIVDCEGYAYLTAHLLGGVKNASGEPRFDVLYASRPGHVIAGVYDPKTTQLFTVNNDTVGAPTSTHGQADIQRVIGQSLVTAGPQIIGISTKQSESRPQTSDEHVSAPRVGSLVWDGKKVIGSILPENQEEFVKFSNATGSNSYAQYVAWKLKQ